MKNSNIIKTLALSALIPFSMWGQAAAFEDFQYEITAENTVTITGGCGGGGFYGIRDTDSDCDTGYGDSD